MANCSESHTSQSGFSYIGLMILIALIGIGLGRAGTVWQTEVQREKERELLFIGDQFRQAIGSYYESTPGAVKQYPTTLEDLLHDPRFPETRRHLRKIYSDPVTGDKEWGLVKAEGRIVGLYSKSEARPLMKVFTGENDQGFSEAKTYADWIFAYKPNIGVGAMPTITDNSTSVRVPPTTEIISQPVNSPIPAPPEVNTLDDPCYTQYRIDSETCSSVCIHAGSDKLERCKACWSTAYQNKLACRQLRKL